MKELISLFLVFFKIGIVNFGGGYAMLPLLSRELVDKRGWTTDSELADYFAIGQCTPGAIAVNVSTFIGYKRKGMLGGIVATLGFVAPAFFIIFIIATLLTNFASNEYVQYALAGIRIAVFALVLYAIVKLAKGTLVDIWTIMLTILVAILAIIVDVVPLFVYVIFAGFYGFFVCYLKNKKTYKVKEEAITKDSNDIEEEIKLLDDKEESKEEVTTDIKEKNNDLLKNILIFILGLLSGMILGVIAIPITFIFKNKKYRNGVYATLVLWFVILVSLIVMLCNNNNPIMFRLYGEFFRVGISAFGGGLATIPFLKELGTTSGWFTQTDLANMIAVSESTPGAMGINMSTYVGYTVIQNEFGNYFISFLGSMISTLGLVSPSIIVIFIVSLFLNKFKDNKYVKWVFYGLRAASIGLIIAALYSIVEISLFNIYLDSAGKSLSAFKVAFDNRGDGNFFSQVANFFDGVFNWKHLALGLGFVIGVFKFKKHPIIYIVIAAVLGILLRL
ncbi:MAG: chromate transporter [Acholeplasmatales bacterium]|nr:chromate transporter [Acholeplasmatales bacterium]